MVYQTRVNCPMILQIGLVYNTVQPKIDKLLKEIKSTESRCTYPRIGQSFSAFYYITPPPTHTHTNKHTPNKAFLMHTVSCQKLQVILYPPPPPRPTFILPNNEGLTLIPYYSFAIF